MFVGRGFGRSAGPSTGRSALPGGGRLRCGSTRIATGIGACVRGIAAGLGPASSARCRLGFPGWSFARAGRFDEALGPVGLAAVGGLPASAPSGCGLGLGLLTQLNRGASPGGFIGLARGGVLAGPGLPGARPAQLGRELGAQHLLELRRNFAPWLGRVATASAGRDHAAAMLLRLWLALRSLVASPLLLRLRLRLTRGLRIARRRPATVAFAIDGRGIGAPHPAATSALTPATASAATASFCQQVLWDLRLGVVVLIRRDRREPLRSTGHADL
jgi:hypothetical protein